MNTGLKLKIKRMEKGLNQEKMGEVIGVSRQTVSSYERGTFVPRPENMKKIAKVLDSTVQELFFND